MSPSPAAADKEVCLESSSSTVRAASADHKKEKVGSDAKGKKSYTGVTISHLMVVIMDKSGVNMDELSVTTLRCTLELATLRCTLELAAPV